VKKSARKTRKKYDSEDSKKRLLSAAMDIFSKSGFDAATTRAIAKKANVNDSLIQRYFGGKLGLLLALSVDFKTRVTEVSMNSPGGSLESDLEFFIRTKLAFSKKHKKIIKIFITQAIINPEFRKEASRFSKADNFNLVSRIKEFQVSGQVSKNFDAAQVGRFINILPITLSLLTEIICSIDPAYEEEFVAMAVRLLSLGLKRD
jgi:AcrR family transcriptional regulator